MSVSGPGCVKTNAILLCDAPVGWGDPPRRVFWFLGICAAGAGFWAGFWVRCGDLAGWVRKGRPTSPYAALMAAISGAMPMMFMTRLRL